MGESVIRFLRLTCDECSPGIMLKLALFLVVLSFCFFKASAQVCSADCMTAHAATLAAVDAIEADLSTNFADVEDMLDMISDTNRETLRKLKYGGHSSHHGGSSRHTRHRYSGW